MTGDARLGKVIQRTIAQSEIIVGTASLWEMVLKNGKGKLPLPEGSLTEQLEAQGFVILPILPRRIEAARGLTCTHAEPFDRLLIAQAYNERLTLLTRDAAILALGLDDVVEG